MSDRVKDTAELKGLERAFRAYPDRISEIRTLAEKDASFREILADHEEMLAWLAAHDHQPTSDPVELEHARELVRAFEQEILDRLKKCNAGTGEEDKDR